MPRSPFERGPQQKSESAYKVAEEDVRWMLGDVTDEEWQDAQEAFTDLRSLIEKMQWFSAGPNSVSAGKRLEQWMELAFAPADQAQEEEITAVLARLGIVPWEETEGNVRVLIVENKRDVALLRGGLIFDYLSDEYERKERERVLEEERVRYAKQMEEVSRYVLALREKEMAERMVREQEQAIRQGQMNEERMWNLRIDTEGQEFRRMKQEEKDARITALLASIPRTPKEDFEKPTRLPQDQFYRFGYPHTARRGTVRGPAAEKTDLAINEEEPMDVDEFISQMDQEFAEGRVNEESLSEGLIVAERGNSSAPNMALFPKKYEWVVSEGKRGFLRERSTKETITNDAIEDVVLFAQSATGNERNTAIRELSLLQRALILYVIRKVHDRNTAANPDDMLQAAIQGLAYAVDHYDKRPEGYFKSYMIPCIEGHVRKVAANAQFKSIRVPQNISADRKKVILAEQAVRSQNPGRAVKSEEVARLLYDDDVIQDPSIDTYDRYVRKVLATYEEIGLEDFDTESFNLHDVDMLGEPLMHVPDHDNRLMEDETREAIDNVLLSLTPREERVLRKYHELHIKDGEVALHVYQKMQAELQSETSKISVADIQEKVRSLTSKGSLLNTEVLDSLSESDRHIADTYMRFLNKEMADETLETVGADLGVTRERVRQIILKGLRKTGHPSRGRSLRRAAPYLPSKDQ